MDEHDVRARLALHARVEGKHRQRPAHVEQPRVPVAARRHEHVRVALAARDALHVAPMPEEPRGAAPAMREVDRSARSYCAWAGGKET